MLGALREQGYRRVYTSDRRVARADSWLQPRYSVCKGDSAREAARRGVPLGTGPSAAQLRGRAGQAVEMTTVLIGFAESLAAVESAWCLADAGYDVVAFTRAGKRPALAASRHVRVVPVPAPEDGIEACVAGAACAVVAHEQPDALLPLDDHSVLLADRLQDLVPIAGPTGPLVRIALDKREQLTLAEKAGFPVPPTVVLDVGDQPDAPDEHGPWIVKCALATVVDDDKIRRPGGGIARKMPRHRPACWAGSRAPSLIQPVIEGAGEGLFGIAIGGLAFALSAHQRIRMMNPRGSGSSAARSIPVDPELADAARRFVETSGWHGIFMLEFLRDRTGRPWFMELNGRTWGSMALARHRGWPYPVWAVSPRSTPTGGRTSRRRAPTGARATWVARSSTCWPCCAARAAPTRAAGRPGARPWWP